MARMGYATVRCAGLFDGAPFSTLAVAIREGRGGRPLLGGIDAWTDAGFEVDVLPESSAAVRSTA